MNVKRSKVQSKTSSYQLRKRMVMSLFFLVSSLFLWYFSLALAKEKSLFYNYLFFSILTFGGGVSYHLLSEMWRLSCNEKNVHLWNKIQARLALSSIGYVIVAIAIVIGKFLIKGILGYSAALIGVFAGMLWVVFFVMKLHVFFRDLFIFNKRQRKQRIKYKKRRLI